MSEDEIFELAFDKAGDICGADPAYFGEEGTLEIMNQINLMGYECCLQEGLIKIKAKEVNDSMNALEASNELMRLELTTNALKNAKYNAAKFFREDLKYLQLLLDENNKSIEDLKLKLSRVNL